MAAQRRWLLRLAVALLGCQRTLAVQVPPSLDAFIGFPARSSLVGATVAGKDRLAWVEKQRGVVSLWAADEAEGWAPRRLAGSSEAEGWAPRRLAGGSEDDGGDISFLRFTPDGSSLVYVAGPIADTNPNHLRVAPVGATYNIPFKGGFLVRVSDASAMALSEDSRSFLYSLDGGATGASASLWQQGLNEMSSQAKVLFSVKQGRLADVALRPGSNSNSTVLAFANTRGDHGFVGVFSAGWPALVWAAPSTDTDVQPAWSPSGRSLAWVRARVSPGNVGYGPFDGNMGNRGPNFGIMVAQVTFDASGRPAVSGSREVFRDDRFGMLSFGFGVRPLLWANDASVVFGTEAMSTWAHAVILDSEAAPHGPRELAPGACEDMSWLLDSARQYVYLVNNCQDIDGMGVERVNLATFVREVVASPSLGAPAVSGASSSGYGLAPLPRHVAFLGASYNAPAALFVRAAGQGPEDLRQVTLDRNFSGAAFVRPELIRFPSSDGTFQLHAQLFMPPALAAGQRVPGCVYTHGGSERQMYTAFHYDPTYAQEYAANQWLASKGFAVLSVNYRSGVGYGHAFRVCPRCQAAGAAEYLDVREAGVQLAKHPGVQPERVGIWGLSYGGLNAEQACARDSGLFRACVAIAGIFNWVTASRYGTDLGNSVFDADVQPNFPGGFRSLGLGPEPAWAGPDWAKRAEATQALLLESSPAGHVINLTSPMLLIHGDSDEEVAFQESIGAVRAVQALGRNNVEVMAFPDESHGMGTYQHQLESLQAMGDFLAAHLAEPSQLRVPPSAAGGPLLV